MPDESPPDSQPTANVPPFDGGEAVPPTTRLGGDMGEHLGQWIGPYKLLDVIGEGGFGVVFLAERREPMIQRVALKIIKPGMDSKAVIARFEQERQALAVMDHPNVAKVLDGGVTPTGRPYFVMELVKGEPITKFCDRNRLTNTQRLELFIPVCEAVQHAHMKGIIHRDIKPSNILVAPIGDQDSDDSASTHGMLVKVIDFGVAKAISHTLTDKTIFTEKGQVIGTPEYMSPEQAEMGATDIDTRTDVYSLGVVLYELLSGTLPFDAKSLRSAGYGEIQRIIRQVDAPRPSTKLSKADDQTGAGIARARQADREKIASELRRELEWIPMKALRKDRRERYATAHDLAEDVRRYLTGDPLDAGPESAAYRLKKILKRHRGPVLAGAAVFLVLVLGIVGTLREARRADRKAADEAAARQVAEQRTDEAIEERKKADAERMRADTKADEADAERERAKGARKAAELEAYTANLIAADAALAANEPSRVRARLDDCPESLRGWEWKWLDARSDSSLAVLRGHQGTVSCAAFSPDGRRVVTASWDGTARVWDAVSGEAIAVLPGHANRVETAAFSPDGLQVVTASPDDRTARVWDVSGGKPIAVLRHEDAVASAAFSPSGKRLVTACSDGTARVWDVPSGNQTAILRHGDGVAFAAFNHDGTRVVTTCTDGTARVWDAASGERLAPLRGHAGGIRSAAFSPDGTRVVTASWDKTARVWNAESGETIAVLFGHVGGIRSAAFSPDGTRVITASWDTTARVWHASTGRSLAVLRGQGSMMNSASFSPDGTRVVTSSDDRTARVWDVATERELAVLRGHEDRVTSAVFSLDGARIVTSSLDGIARVWDAERTNDLAPLAGNEGDSAAPSPDGGRIVTWRDATARVWDASRGRALAVLRRHGGRIRSAAFSPDGTRVVTASSDETARVWDAASGNELGVLQHQRSVHSAAFSPDGTRVVTRSGDNTARLWDALGGRELALQHESFVNSAAFSPDGTHVVTASDDATARVWTASSGKTLKVLSGHQDRVTSATFSPDGTRVVTVSWDTTARVWNAADWAEPTVLRGHGRFVHSAAISANGMRVATASADRTAQVWDAVTGAKLAVLRGHGSNVNSIAFSPCGQRVVTALSDGSARVWDASSGRELAVLRGHEPDVVSATFSPDGDRVVTVSDAGIVRVWDSVPYRNRFPFIGAARDAEARARPLVQVRLRAGETIQQIRDWAVADRSLPDVDRTAYLVVTLPFVEEEIRTRAGEAYRLNETLWPRVASRVTDPAAVPEVTLQADRLRTICLDNPHYVKTAGVAFFRLGRHREALELLNQSDELYVGAGKGEQPANWAFIAMAHWQLGEMAEARAAAAKFRSLAAQEEWKDNQEVAGWIKEVDEMVKPD